VGQLIEFTHSRWKPPLSTESIPYPRKRAIDAGSAGITGERRTQRKHLKGRLTKRAHRDVKTSSENTANTSSSDEGEDEEEYGKLEESDDEEKEDTEC
jgi:hypothetical protein